MTQTQKGMTEFFNADFLGGLETTMTEGRYPREVVEQTVEALASHDALVRALERVMGTWLGGEWRDRKPASLTNVDLSIAAVRAALGEGKS
jgi:hypothetical protein